MKTYILYISVLIISITSFHNSGFAQEINFKDRANIKLSFSRIESNIGNVTGQEIKSNLALEFDYGLLKTMESKIYYGITISDFSINHYGVGLKYQILPHLIKASNFRFDFYLSGKIGQFQAFDSNWHDWEYGIGPGLNFHPFDKIGISFEYYLGKYFFRDNNNLRFGISYRLN